VPAIAVMIPDVHDRGDSMEEPSYPNGILAHTCDFQLAIIEVGRILAEIDADV
jgi:hypothetical protein